MSAWVFGLVGWAAVASLFSAVTAVRVWRLRAARRAGPLERAPAVFLLRPVDAPSARELANLAAPIDYPGALEQVVLSPYRPALPRTVRWLPSDPVCANRKVGHLLYGLATLECEGHVVLAVDADVRVDGALVQALVAPLLRGAALSTAALQLEAGAGVAARAVHGLLTHTHHSFVALHAMSAGAPAVCGKALGLSRRAREVLGELTDHIGEDLELSQRLHAMGLEVALAAAPAHLPAPAAQPWSDAVERFTRWMLVLRSHRPALYPTVPLLFVPTLPLVVLAAALPSPPLLLSLAGLLVARTALALTLQPARAWHWLLGEALLCVAFLRSLRRRAVTWRGRTFALTEGGRMRPLPLGPGGLT